MVSFDIAYSWDQIRLQSTDQRSNIAVSGKVINRPFFITNLMLKFRPIYLWHYFLFHLHRILSTPKAQTILVNGAVRKGERLMPPSALDLLLRATFPSTSARVKVRTLLGHMAHYLYMNIHDLLIDGYHIGNRKIWSCVSYTQEGSTCWFSRKQSYETSLSTAYDYFFESFRRRYICSRLYRWIIRHNYLWMGRFGFCFFLNGPDKKTS